MAANTFNVVSESATNEDKVVPSTSSAGQKESREDETTNDAPEQTKTEFREKSTNLDTESKQKKTKIIGTGALYRGGGIKNTFHGVSYQIKLPMLFIIRGLRQACAFQVATEVEVADKLDDLLFLYDKDEIGFFQAKHKLNENLKITEEQLLNIESDFGVQKYFNSYKKILNEKELADVLKGRNVIVIINTNIGIDESVLESFEPATASSALSNNKILALGTEEERKNYYIIKKESDLYVKLVHMLEELEQPGANISQPPTRLAENLAKAVANNNKKSIKADELLGRHRDWLLANVLEVGKEDNKTQVRYFVTFRDSFLTGSEQNELNFGKIFYDTYLKQTQQDDPTRVQKDLSGVKFQVPRDFAAPKNKNAKSGLDKVKTFLGKLVFVVKQLNEIELGDKIAEEVSDYMVHTDRQSINSKFQSYIQDWAKQKEGRYLTNWDVECQFAAWGYENLNHIRMEEIKKYKCEFKESNEVIKNLSNFLSTKNDTHSTYDVLYFYYEETLFSKIKLCQVFETWLRENIDQQFIFCDFRDLIEYEQTKMCPVKAFSSETCNTMFVSLQDCNLNDTELNMLHRLLHVVIESNYKAEKPSSNKQRKRLLMSIPENQKTEFIKKNCFINQELKSLSLDDFNNSFGELNEKSRQHLIKKGHIKLRGYYVTDLISTSELDFCMRDDMLLKFISNELEINDAIVERNQYNEEVQQYYTNRSLLPVIVDKGIEKDSLFYLVRGYIPHEDIRSQEVVVISSDEKLFDYFRKIYIIVHWLKESNNKYGWITSQGALTNIRKYVSEQEPDFDSDFDSDLGLDRTLNIYIPVTKVGDVKNDVVLISASPGMGKSILLSHIAEQSKKEDDSFIVFKTNLTDTIDKLDSLKKEENVTLEQAIHFVFINTQVESSEIEESESIFNLLTVQEDKSMAFSPSARFGPLDQLRAIVFCNLYNKGKIVLLLDGFDEIAPDYCKTTLNLLQTLKQSKVRKMWVTTRPYAITKDLEHYLETFAYTFKPLSKNDQLTIFENFWKHKIKSRHTEIQSSLNNFLESLDMKTFSILHKTDRKRTPNEMIASFMGVPLHCYMMAKVLTKDFTKFCSQNIDDAPAITSITIFDLYSKFFDIKFDEILHSEVNLKNPKNLSLRQKKKVAESDHGKLALLQIFDQELLAELVLDEDRVTLINNVNNGNEKTGIVTEIVGDKPQFVHRTFAEYFAAHHLAEVLLNPVENKRKETARSLLYNNVTSNLEYYYVLFTFFNYIVASKSNNKHIFEAAIHGNIQILSETENVNEIFDPLNRTAMHLVAIDLFNVLHDYLDHYRRDLTTAATMHNYFRNFIQLLCESMTKCSPDTLFMWTPTHYLAMSCCEAVEQRKFPFFIRYLSDITQDILSRTPLMLFILRNPYIYDWIQKYALLNWIDVNTQDKLCKTALHYLLEKYVNLQDHSDFAKILNSVCFLLKLGARIDIPDIRGKTSEDLIKLLFADVTRDMLENWFRDLMLHVQTFNMDDIFQESWKYINKHVREYLWVFEEPDDLLSSRPIFDPYVLEKIDSECMKMILRCGLLYQLRIHYNTPILPVPDSEVIALYFMENNLYRNYNEKDNLIAKTDLSALSTHNHDDCNKIIFLLIETYYVASILLSKFPHLVDVVDSRGRSALHYAVNNKDNSRITLLIKSNARFDIPDNTGKMPAHIKKSNVLYYQNTFDDEKLSFINRLTCEVASPLVLTMDLYPIRTQIDSDFIVLLLCDTIARVLLSHYPDAVNTKDSKGRTALHYAIKTENTRAVCYLIDKNARADIADNCGKYPAHLNKENLFPYLESKRNDPAQKRYVEVTYSKMKNKLCFINTLPFVVAKPLVLTMALVPPLTPFDHGLLKDILDEQRTIASVLWAEYSNLLPTNRLKGYCSYFDSSNVSNEIVSRLLDIYCIEDFSYNIVKSNEILKLVVELFSSVKSNDLSRVQAVLKRVETYNPTKYKTLTRKFNASKNFVFHYYFQPGFFHLPLRERFPELRSTISVLCDETNVAISVVNARSNDGGKTALHYAAEIGNVEIVDALLSHGAYYNVPDGHGLTPSQIAKTRVNLAIHQLLEKVENLFDSLNNEFFYNIGTGEDTSKIMKYFNYVNEFSQDYFIRKDEPKTIDDTFVGIYVIQDLGVEVAENSSDDENSYIMKIHEVMKIHQ